MWVAHLKKELCQIQNGNEQIYELVFERTWDIWKHAFLGFLDDGCGNSSTHALVRFKLFGVRQETRLAIKFQRKLLVSFFQNLPAVVLQL